MDLKFLDDLAKHILLVLYIILPGFVGYYFYCARNAAEKPSDKEIIIYTFMIGMFNFLIASPLLKLAYSSRINEIYEYVIIVLMVFILPVSLVLIFECCRRLLAGRRIILEYDKTPWDFVFKQVKEGAWIILETKDGKKIGGKFGANSFAGSYPLHGHIYIQEAWEVDDDRKFLKKVDGSPGFIISPEGYNMIWIYRK